MRLSRCDRGFVFSLDATLGILVVMIVMAGVARVGGSGLIYEQYGYLRLQRIANDALEALYIVGTIDNRVTPAIDNIVFLLNQGRKGEAESLAENWLRRIIPKDIQFRFRIGTENRPILDNVFPTPGNEAGWRSAFENASEMAVAVRVVILKPENLEPSFLYVWRWPRA
ncbi:MAG: hypothetical protein ACK4GQ_00470 [Candidatus Hadarchaeales archaeon]